MKNLFLLPLILSAASSLAAGSGFDCYNQYEAPSFKVQQISGNQFSYDITLNPGELSVNAPVSTLSQQYRMRGTISCDADAAHPFLVNCATWELSLIHI